MSRQNISTTIVWIGMEFGKLTLCPGEIVSTKYSTCHGHFLYPQKVKWPRVNIVQIGSDGHSLESCFVAKRHVSDILKHVLYYVYTVGIQTNDRNKPRSAQWM